MGLRVDDIKTNCSLGETSELREALEVLPRELFYHRKNRDIGIPVRGNLMDGSGLCACYLKDVFYLIPSSSMANEILLPEGAVEASSGRLGDLQFSFQNNRFVLLHEINPLPYNWLFTNFCALDSDCGLDSDSLRFRGGDGRDVKKAIEGVEALDKNPFFLYLGDGGNSTRTLSISYLEAFAESDTTVIHPIRRGNGSDRIAIRPTAKDVCVYCDGSTMFRLGENKYHLHQEHRVVK